MSFAGVFDRLEQAFGEYSDKVTTAQHFIDFFTRIRDEGTASIGMIKTPSKRRHILTDNMSSNMALSNYFHPSGMEGCCFNITTTRDLNKFMKEFCKGRKPSAELNSRIGKPHPDTGVLICNSCYKDTTILPNTRTYLMQKPSPNGSVGMGSKLDHQTQMREFANELLDKNVNLNNKISYLNNIINTAEKNKALGLQHKLGTSFFLIISVKNPTSRVAHICTSFK